MTDGRLLYGLYYLVSRLNEDYDTFFSPEDILHFWCRRTGCIIVVRGNDEYRRDGGERKGE